MKPRTITIYTESRGFNVHEGERYTGPLSWDEMVGQLASMTLPRERCTDTGQFGMRTPEEWTEQRDRRMRRWMPSDCDLSDPARDAVHALAREFGVRGGPFDELLAAADQPDPRVRYALLLLQACKDLREQPIASPVDDGIPF